MKPNIRFNGFSDEWVEKKLGEIANLYQPKTISSKELINKGVPVFGVNGYIGYYSKANHLLDQVTISARGANTGHPSYVKGPVWITGNSMVVNIDDIPINKYFLYTLFLKYGFKKYVTGGAQPQLIRDVLLHVPIQLPTLPEQQKIGALFSKYDTIIGLREQKLEELNALKKGLLQQMFPKTGAKVPELRFEGFADEWVERKLGDVSDVKYGHDYKNVSQIGNVPVYGTGGMLAMINKCQSESLDAVGLGRKGTINKPFILKAPFWTVDTLFQIYPKVSLDLFFQLYLFDNINWLKYNESTGVPSLSKSNIEKVVRNFPTLPEQQKIGQLFKHLDDRISNEQAKIEQLKEQKQGLLQRMLTN